MPVRYETSTEPAARFRASQQRKQERRARRRRELTRRLSRKPVAPPVARPAPPRIIIDLAEPTLRLIHDVLLDVLAMGEVMGDRLNLTLIAEQMVAVALGEPPCDDPPLTDREGD